MNDSTRSTTPMSHPGSPSLPTVGIPNIKVVGLGGGGSNAINRMIELGLTGVEFIAANTDRQALSSSLANVRIQLGPKVTRGLGAGGDPRLGAAAAMESARELAAALSGADMIFITAGMGGGTGTGSAAVAAEIGRETGAVVLAIVTLPFSFEMSRRAKNAREGVQALMPQAHTLITVPNDRLLEVVSPDISLEVAFRLADDVLRQGIQGVSELVTQPGLINVDFAHVRQLLLRGGGAHMAIGLGEGEGRVQVAIDQALHHPLIEIDSLDQASGVLVHVSGGDDLALYEIGEAITDLRTTMRPDTDIILGATTDRALSGRAQVILIVTGIGGRAVPVAPPTAREGTREMIESAAIQPAAADDLDMPAFLRRRALFGG